MDNNYRNDFASFHCFHSFEPLNTTMNTNKPYFLFILFSLSIIVLLDGGTPVANFYLFISKFMDKIVSFISQKL